MSSVGGYDLFPVRLNIFDCDSFNFNLSLSYNYPTSGLLTLQYLGAYTSSKTALFDLTKVLAKELAPENIRVNTIAPGLIQSDFNKFVRSLLHKAMCACMLIFDRYLAVVEK